MTTKNIDNRKINLKRLFQDKYLYREGKKYARIDKAVRVQGFEGNVILLWGIHCKRPYDRWYRIISSFELSILNRSKAIGWDWKTYEIKNN